MRRSTLASLVGIVIITALTVLALVWQGLEATSWWAAIVGTAIAALLAIREVVHTKSIQANQQGSNNPDLTQTLHAHQRDGSLTVAKDIAGDNIQIGDNNSNIRINRD
jgi:Na+(H+)/acetate symporter ActP